MKLGIVVNLRFSVSLHKWYIDSHFMNISENLRGFDDT